MNQRQQDELARIKAALASPEPRRWVFAGDSITHGALHTFGSRDYTELFSERLRFELKRVRDHVLKTGCSGWRVTQLEKDVEWGVLQYRPHVVSIHFGMNDCCNGPAGLPPFREAYLRVIESIRAGCGAAILMHVPNPIFEQDAARFPNLPAYGQMVRDLAAESGCALLDHEAEWRGKWRWPLMSDAIHPGAAGHREMAFSLFRLLGIFDGESSQVCRLGVPLPR